MASTNRSAMSPYPASDGWNPSDDTVIVLTRGPDPVNRSTTVTRPGNVAARATIAALYAVMRARSVPRSVPAYAGTGRRSGTLPTKIRASVFDASGSTTERSGDLFTTRLRGERSGDADVHVVDAGGQPSDDARGPRAGARIGCADADRVRCADGDVPERGCGRRGRCGRSGRGDEQCGSWRPARRCGRRGRRRSARDEYERDAEKNPRHFTEGT